ncbi:MAG: hypothetical protein WC548_02955 [Candidatus Pacearchaeota archaeon]
MKKKFVTSFELTILLFSTFAFSFLIYSADNVSADTSLSEPTSCCEKTKDGAFCLNTNEDDCAANYKISQTSCETTSYCKLGTCYDSDEGICMENTPQNICVSSGGTWDERELAEVPQCQPGCCIIADQAAFVSLVRCKKLSNFFGVENNFKKDINSEIQCIATAQSQDMGACVYEKDYEKICKFTTRAECSAPETIESVNSSSSGKKFYKDYLCSAEELNTICARQTSTICYGGKVYWVDSCGNRENVYSSNKDKSWNRGRIAEPDTICSPNSGTNKNCGNCDYFLGTRCAEWDGSTGKPSGSEYYCKKTECVDRNGDKKLNGESWCVYDGEVGNGLDSVGSRYFREICVDGQVKVEPCAEYRNEICLEGSIKTSEGDYSTSACRVNRWQDCILQDEQEDCLNIDKRDCLWLPSITGIILGSAKSDSSKQTGFSNPTAGETVFSNPTATGNVISPITGEIAWGGTEKEDEKTMTTNPDGICVPNYPPGLKFWEGTINQQTCAQASAKCIIKYEKGILDGSWECIENCECEDEDWALDVNRVCAALGDCGGYVNYLGKYTDDGYEWKSDNDKKEFSPNNINKISGGFTGMVAGFIDKIIITGNTLAQTPTPVSGIQVAEGIAARSSTLITKEAVQVEVVKFAEMGPFSSMPARETILIAKDTPITLSANGGTFVSGDKVYSLTNAQIETVRGAGGVGQQTSKHFLSGKLGLEAGGLPDALATGIQWAAVAYGAGYLIGSLFGMSKQNTQSLSTAMAAGSFTWQSLATYKAVNLGWFSANPFLTGLGVGAIVFIAMYKKYETKTVSFDCLPYQAPSGGNDCEKCNDPTLPCSEYRCKSLGQNCELVNIGTKEEKCVNINPRDVNSPVIKPNTEELTDGHKYTNIKTSPPGPGFSIISTNNQDGCLQAFTPLKFGIQTNEPAQCKIDFNHTTKFDDMISFMGGSNLYSYNHTEQFSLPGAKLFENSSLILQNGKDMTFFIRCKDKNGNENSAEYAVNLCVDPSPDTTAPQIKATSIENNGCIAENYDSVDVEFYVNEPADCKWDFQDTSYENMGNEMTCSNELYQVNANYLFTCKTELSGIARDGTNFYVRCQDQPESDINDRITNKESFVFSLRGSTELKLSYLMPNSTLSGSVNPAPIELYAETVFGCNNGQSICYYSTTGDEDDYIMFYDTNNEDGISTQRQDLASGDHKYYIRCIDAGGNVVEDMIRFNLDIDTSAPTITRIYEENKNLKIITVRSSECAYSFNNCDFSFEEGVEMPYANSTIHVAEWNKDKTYYIKCRDEFKNEDADCSAIVKPSDNFL